MRRQEHTYCSDDCSRWTGRRREAYMLFKCGCHYLLKGARGIMMIGCRGPRKPQLLGLFQSAGRGLTLGCGPNVPEETCRRADGN